MKRLSVTFLGLVLIGLVVVGLCGILWALNADHNRPAPLMDYAPQEIGMHDSSYAALTGHDCRDCHGYSLAARHHYSERNTFPECYPPGPPPQAGCLYCHPSWDGTGSPPKGEADEYEYGLRRARDCMADECHPDDATWLAPPPDGHGWHHNTDLSAPGNCVFCHSPNRINPINPDWLDLDSNPPSEIIPSVWNCENCHWAQAVVAAAPGFDPSTSPTSDAGHPSTYDHYDWSGEFAGYHEYGAPILGNLDTHHMLEKGPYDSSCGQCHPIVGTGMDRDWDYGEEHAIRYCMQCHDDLTAHTIQPHVAGVSGWDAAGFHVPDLSNTDVTDIAPTNYRTFDGQEMCIGCHEQSVTNPPPVRPSCTLAIDPYGSQPKLGSPGCAVYLRGECFGEGYTYGSESVQFKKKPDGSMWIDMPIQSWTDTLIEFEIPVWAWEDGNYWVRVKTPAGESNKTVFTVYCG